MSDHKRKGRHRCPAWGRADEVRAMYQAGRTMKDIATVVGTTDMTVGAILRSLGVAAGSGGQKKQPPTPGRRPKGPIWGEANLVKESYESGESASQIAARYGVTPPTVCAVLRSLGVSVRPKGRGKASPEEAAASRRRSRRRREQAAAIRDGRRRAMLDAYQSGMTLREVGEKFGVTGERVAQILGRRGKP